MDTLGRYRILRKLGEGGMGVVFAAHDERLDRPVAIKRIRPSADGQERQRLWREARASASVSHPNVCQLYEIGEDGGELFLAMELLDGEPLSARLARGALAPNEAAQVALSVLSALSALHDKGIVHRDLKPSNIFLSQHGVKLVDFGLARAFDQAVTRVEAPVTQPGLMIGTPRYMAPEQIEGNHVDVRSDLFALGIVLYEMVAGRPPFAGGSIFEVARALVHDEPPALGGSSSIVALDRIINRALRKQPDARYQSAGVFALGAARDRLDGHGGRPPDDATRRAAVPHAAPGSVDRLSRLQPCGCHQHGALRAAIARRPLDSRSGRLCDRHPRFPRAGQGAECRCGAARHSAQQRRSGSRQRAARAGAVRNTGARHHVAIAERRDLPSAGRPRAVDRGIALPVADGA